MGWRYRRSVKIFPGLKMNLSKTGTSFSMGRPGATVNFGKRGVRSTVGIPGTGISYTTHHSLGKPARPMLAPSPQQQGKAVKWVLIGLAMGAAWVAFHLL